MDTTPKVKRESKNKIRVEFERAPLWERIKAKFFSMFFLKRVVYVIFRFVLLLGVSYVILYPYIAKIFNSFMSPSDFKDVTVMLLSKSPTLDQYKYIILENGYFSSILSTFLRSFSTALIQTLVCALIAYGLAKFKFKGNGIVFALVIATLMIPMEAIQYVMKDHFFNFADNNVLGKVIEPFMTWFERGQMRDTMEAQQAILANGGTIGDFADAGLEVNKIFPEDIGRYQWNGFENSYVPMYLFSFTGLGFRNGLFIFMLRQFFKGVPDELEESAYVDGSSTFKTFFRIILPISVPMLITVFIFSFAWQWTDNFYSSTFFNDIYIGANGYPNMQQIVQTPESLKSAANDLVQYRTAVQGTGTLLIAIPLIIAYVFLQDKIVQGVERSGIVG